MTKNVPVIQDIAVIATMDKGNNPVGEAPTARDPALIYPMTWPERQSMLQRLEDSICELMDEAQEAYQAVQFKSDTNEIDSDCITRLSTNEFFFYTKEPLTLMEFEELLNPIAGKAKIMSSGVHLILGSFAVQTNDNIVMNVTPHIVCGPSSDIHLLIKNFASSIDVRYKIADGMGDTETLPLLEGYKSYFPMPQIMVNGEFKEFTFNNIIACQTPSGTPFITAIELCSDHEFRVAKTNFLALAKEDPTFFKQPVSHVVISNCIDLKKESCIGSVMHVDPLFSPKKCKKGFSQRVSASQKNAFGNDSFKFFKVKPQQVKQLIGDISNNYPYKTVERKHSSYTTLDKIDCQEDKHSEEFQNFKNKYQAYKGDYLKTQILDHLKEQIEDTTSLAELNKLKNELKNSYEIKILKDPQGRFTQRVGTKTSSQNALKSMIKQQENYLSNAGLKY